MAFDLCIRGARLVDGQRDSACTDLYIKDGKIAHIGPLEGAETAQVIDGRGKYLFPGFVDIHRHADLVPFSGPAFQEAAQGITTMVSGNCGFSVAPNSPQYFDALNTYAEPILGKIPQQLRGYSTAQFYQAVARQPLTVNCGYLVGNGGLRVSVKGFDPEPMTSEQLALACQRLDESLAQGALGYSLGLMYTPECFYQFEELKALAQVAAKHRKPLIAHIRGEGTSVVKSVEEILRLGRETGVAVHISHLKAAGRDNWHRTIHTLLDMLDRAEADGFPASFDAYPYDAGSTTLLSLFPPETLAGGTEHVLQEVSSPQGREHIRRRFAAPDEHWDNLVYTTGWDRFEISGSSDPREIGRDIQSLADQAGVPPADYAMDLLLREAGNVPIILRHMAPEDVEVVLRHPRAILISDALYSTGGTPHPRKFGTHVHFLTEYVKGGKLSLEDAIYKMTGRPAQFLGLEGRGALQEGNWADLVLVDWQALQDRATYRDPAQLPLGIDLVLVNGKAVCQMGVPACPDAGKLLTHPI